MIFDGLKIDFDLKFTIKEDKKKKKIKVYFEYF